MLLSSNVMPDAGVPLTVTYKKNVDYHTLRRLDAAALPLRRLNYHSSYSGTDGGLKQVATPITRSHCRLN